MVVHSPEQHTLHTRETRVVSYLQHEELYLEMEQIAGRLQRHSEHSSAYRNPASWNWLPGQKHLVDV